MVTLSNYDLFADVFPLAFGLRHMKTMTFVGAKGNPERLEIFNFSTLFGNGDQTNLQHSVHDKLMLLASLADLHLRQSC